MSYSHLNTTVELFSKAIKNNKLSHLYLISGPSGSGKKTLAYKISSLLLEQPVEKLLEGHINLHFIEPEGQNIRARQIDLLQLEFSKTSLVPGYRVYIIDSIEKLNQTSANRLLKFLEEPTNTKTIGFLLTTNISVVISTIISRSQHIYLPAVDENTLKEQLLEKDFDLLSAELLPFINKNVETLQSLYEDVNIKGLIELFNNYAKALIEEENLWLYVEKELKDIRYDKQMIHYFLQFLLIFFLDIFKLKNNQEVSISSFLPIYKVLKATNNDILQQKLEKVQELLHKINYNINIDMAFSQLILHIG